jgi:hypothetical protein
MLAPAPLLSMETRSGSRPPPLGAVRNSRVNPKQASAARYSAGSVERSQEDGDADTGAVPMAGEC